MKSIKRRRPRIRKKIAPRSRKLTHKQILVIGRGFALLTAIKKSLQIPN